MKFTSLDGSWSVRRVKYDTFSPHLSQCSVSYVSEVDGSQREEDVLFKDIESITPVSDDPAAQYIADLQSLVGYCDAMSEFILPRLRAAVEAMYFTEGTQAAQREITRIALNSRLGQGLRRLLEEELDVVWDRLTSVV